MDMAVSDHLILVDKRKRCHQKLLSIRSAGSMIVLLVQTMVRVSFFRPNLRYFLCVGERISEIDQPFSDFHKKKEEVLKETEAIFSDEDEVVDLEAELRQKLKDEKISSFHPEGHPEDDDFELQGEDEIEFPISNIPKPTTSSHPIRGRSESRGLRSDHITESHDPHVNHQSRDFDDVGTSFAIRETEPNLVKIEESKKKIMLWSNPSPFGASINQPKIIRHVEAPKPKGYTPLPPTQKFSPAGNFSVKHGQPARER